MDPLNSVIHNKCEWVDLIFLCWCKLGLKSNCTRINTQQDAFFKDNKMPIENLVGKFDSSLLSPWYPHIVFPSMQSHMLQVLRHTEYACCASKLLERQFVEIRKRWHCKTTNNTDIQTKTLPFIASIFRSCHTYLLTYVRSRALLEKLPIVQLFKNFPAFYGIQRLVVLRSSLGSPMWVCHHVSLYVFTLHHHYGALSTIPALLESMALKGAVLDGVWRSSRWSALVGWNGGWWPRKGP
jgi:hypothetical protein